jgi:hypothetical protein
MWNSMSKMLTSLSPYAPAWIKASFEVYARHTRKELSPIDRLCSLLYLRRGIKIDNLLLKLLAVNDIWWKLITFHFTPVTVFFSFNLIANFSMSLMKSLAIFFSLYPICQKNHRRNLTFFLHARRLINNRISLIP